MEKDLRSVLGEPVRGAFRLRYCGGGRLRACSAVLWAALDRAGRKLSSRQGPRPAAWRADAKQERISFVPGLLPYTVRYTNRPTGIQQILPFSGHSSQDSGR